VNWGDANWWMPHSLERVVPQLNVEGAQYFAQQDGAFALETAEPPS
jgi:hypothetical protein